MADSRLFKPLKVGKVWCSSRLGMCPLTRMRASDNHVPLPAMVQYYGQRASVAGTLLVSEGTFISASQAGINNVPGIWNDEQVAAWRSVTDAVHARGSHIFCQLWALGRSANAQKLEEGGFALLSASDVAAPGRATPAPMTADQIARTVGDYAAAAANAVRAGFDGVELHGANGYLIDQFLQDVTNRRDDGYGGSIEGRSRFAVEVAAAVARAVGPDRVGIRLSPWSEFQGMRMADPVPQFADVVRRLAALDLAFLHLVESRVSGASDRESYDAAETLDFAYDLWDRPLLIAGGLTPASAKRLVDEEHPEKDIVAMFGRYFIANPDLPFRIREGLDLSPYRRETFYKPKSLEGYTDHPYSKEFLERAKAAPTHTGENGEKGVNGVNAVNGVNGGVVA